MNTDIQATDIPVKRGLDEVAALQDAARGYEVTIYEFGSRPVSDFVNEELASK